MDNTIDGLGKTIPAIVTPWNYTGLDRQGLENVIRNISALPAFVAMGLTGEGQNLDLRTKMDIVKLLGARTAEKPYTIVAVLDRDIINAAATALFALEHDMHLQMFAPEMIEDRNPDSAVHYIINKTYGGAKFIIYENPQLRARPNDAPLGIEFYQRWARHENIAGAKYSGKDPAFFRELCSLRNSKFKVYLGNDSLIRDTIHQGVEADGVISGLASYKPQLFIDYQRDRKEAVLREIEEFGRTLPSNGDVVQGLKNGFYAQGTINSPDKVTR